MNNTVDKFSNVLTYRKCIYDSRSYGKAPGSFWQPPYHHWRVIYHDHICTTHPATDCHRFHHFRRYPQHPTKPRQRPLAIIDHRKLIVSRRHLYHLELLNAWSGNCFLLGVDGIGTCRYHKDK